MPSKPRVQSPAADAEAQVANAIDVMARHFVAQTAYDHVHDAWAPVGVTSADWEDIQEQVEEIVAEISPTTAEYEDACDLLSHRAAGVPDA